MSLLSHPTGRAGAHPDRTAEASADRLADDLAAALEDERLLRDGAGERARQVLAQALTGVRVVDSGGGSGPRGRASTGGSSRRLPELGAYLGAVLVGSGVLVFLGELWSDLGGLAQLVLLLLAAVVTAGAGLAVTATAGGRALLGGARHGVRRRLASTLLTVGATASAAAVMPAVALLGGRADEGAGAVLWLVLVLAGAASYAVVRSLLAQAVLALGAVALCLTGSEWLLGDGSGDATACAMTASLLVLAGVWWLLAEGGAWAETTAARLGGAAMALVGAQLPIATRPGDGLTVAIVLSGLVAAVALALHLRTGAWPHLGCALLALLLAVTELAYRVTDDVLGAVLALVVGGAVVLAAAGLGWSRRRDGWT